MRPRQHVAAQAVVAWLCATSPALALQPLSEFQAAARTQNPLVRQALAQAVAAEHTQEGQFRIHAILELRAMQALMRELERVLMAEPPPAAPVEPSQADA